ncbi:MAG: hypothetical protein IPJ06_05575 [Saprospiraceae bacterium]|nr:hypothetical protein [Saprospiraceae bacterium]
MALPCMVAGRTDAGVHASRYITCISTRTGSAIDLKYRLNKNLPLTTLPYSMSYRSAKINTPDIRPSRVPTIMSST